MGWAFWIAVVIAGLAVLCVAGAIIQRLVEARDDARFPPPGNLVDVGGRRLHILTKGSAPGPTVVIEQGAGGPSPLWWPVQDTVATFARVCVYDRAGFLWSDPAPLGRSMKTRIEDLHVLLAKTGMPGPYVLVGHSFGGLLVRLYARDYPSEVAGLVLVDAPDETLIRGDGFVGYSRKLRMMLRVADVAARLGIIRAVVAFSKDVPAGFTREQIKAFQVQTARPSFFRAMRDDFGCLEHLNDELTASDDVGSLGDRPLVVISHGQPFPGPSAVLENGWPESQLRQAALSTDSEHVIAENSNHMINMDEPEIVIEAIRRVHAKAARYPLS